MKWFRLTVPRAVIARHSRFEYDPAALKIADALTSRGTELTRGQILSYFSELSHCYDFALLAIKDMVAAGFLAVRIGHEAEQAIEEVRQERSRGAEWQYQHRIPMSDTSVSVGLMQILRGHAVHIIDAAHAAANFGLVIKTDIQAGDAVCLGPREVGRAVAPDSREQLIAARFLHWYAGQFGFDPSNLTTGPAEPPESERGIRWPEIIDKPRGPSPATSDTAPAQEPQPMQPPALAAAT